MTRPDWDTWALSLAQVVATRADCTRAQVGAVLMGRDHRILSVGYNGAPAGIPGCASAGNCPRGQHAERPYPNQFGEPRCRCGAMWPCLEAVQPDSDYGNCVSVHAEENAIRHADPLKLPGGTLYVTRNPCPRCSTLIAAAGIARVVTP